MSAETYRKAAEAFWSTAARLVREAEKLEQVAVKKREAADNQRAQARVMEAKELEEIKKSHSASKPTIWCWKTAPCTL